MFNYSSVTIEGNATRDAEKKIIRDDKQVCNFSLAINHYSKDLSDPKVSYIDVEAWDKLGEFCSDTITKGKRVMVVGELRQDRWQGDDGNIKSKFKVTANVVRHLESTVKNGGSMNNTIETEMAI